MRADLAGITPDALLTGKILGGGVMPAGGVVASAQLFVPLNADPLLHSSTFAGSPLAAGARHEPAGTDRLAVMLIPAGSAGIERAPFWQTTALAGAESDQVTQTGVFVPEALIFYPQDGESMDPIQARGFVWFELLVSASYLGAATNLAERVIARGRGSDEDRASLAIELETTAAALEQVATNAATAGDNDALLARALCVRFGTERAIERVVMPAAVVLGGMSFIESPEVAYLLGVTRALAFHPPSRAAAAGPIARHLAGGPLTL